MTIKELLHSNDINDVQTGLLLLGVENPKIDSTYYVDFSIRYLYLVKPYFTIFDNTQRFNDVTVSVYCNSENKLIYYGG